MTKTTEENTSLDGIAVARLFKFYLQQKNPYVKYKLPLNRVQAKGLYSTYRLQFDRLSKIFNKYGFDVDRYIKTFVIDFNKFERHIETELVSMQTINKYIEYLQIRKQREQIYKNFVKSVKNIVKDCVALNFNNVTDYFRYLIQKRQLSAYYISGKISIYYFAAIPNFRKVIDKLDPISKDEFRMLYDRYEKYNVDINEAFLQMKNIKMNPLSFTNDMILKARNV